MSYLNDEGKPKKRTVAIYARVSTEHEAQLSALDNQLQYYQNILDAHPEWTLYKFYVDEGITGTSTKKRKSFMEMMEAADNKKFDLIITREVSRFARNTVDTLQETRKLRAKKIEVWFTEDNIWTMNDEDGELRLTIMATLAQNESKKTSLRVKAGQMISFQNGVPYGNGNILGYDKTANGYVINPEQAETVRMIYRWYLEGYGQKKITVMLEQHGRLTSTGLTRWQCSYISGVLHNPFYCGTIVYRKQYVPDYLEQKKIDNHGEIENIIVEGKHEPIISKEDFQKVQDVLKAKKADLKAHHDRVRENANIVWNRKLECPCGGHFSRRIWQRKGNKNVYAFRCYRQVKYGGIAYRKKKGLSTEGICDTPMVQQWKLEVMLMMIFEYFWKEKSKVLEICNTLLEEEYRSPEDVLRIENLHKHEKLLEKYKKQMENLLDLCVNDIISSKEYERKKREIQDKVSNSEAEVTRLSESDEASEEQRQKAIKVLQYDIEQDFNFESHSVPDEVIDAFVDKIIVYPDHFEWHLNFMKLKANLEVKGDKRKAEVSLTQVSTEEPPITGCNCRKWQISQRPFKLTTFTAGEEEVKAFMASQTKYKRALRLRPFEFDVYI